MKHFLSLLISCVFILVPVFTVSGAIEVIPDGNSILEDLLPYDEHETSNSTVSILSSVISYFVLLTGVIAVMAIIWGGMNFVAAAGDDEKIKKAKKTIIYAFVGVMVSGLAYAIVETITKVQATF